MNSELFVLRAQREICKHFQRNRVRLLLLGEDETVRMHKGSGRTRGSGRAHGWDPKRAGQRRCGSRYVNPANASHRVDVLVSPRLNPASSTKFLRRARETAQRLPAVLLFSNGCEKCHTSPEIVNFPKEWEMDSVCPNCARRIVPCTCSVSMPFVSR
jgi:hypothetical protein